MYVANKLLWGVIACRGVCPGYSTIVVTRHELVKLVHSSDSFHYEHRNKGCFHDSVVSTRMIGRQAVVSSLNGKHATVTEMDETDLRFLLAKSYIHIISSTQHNKYLATG